MTSPMIVLIIIVFILVIGIFGLLIWSFNKPSPTPPTPPPNPCTVSGLIDISNLTCCQINGTTTSLRYMSNLNMVVAPYSSYYVDVCQGFCLDGFDSQKQDCINGSGSDNFKSCLTQLAPPTGCEQSARPVATDGSQLFYGFSATNAQCPISTIC